ncbi:MAG: hypothetical protein ACTSPE_04990 [Candidatus Thorarchaeota archaeon]
MGIMKAAAVRGLIPAGNKVTELRSDLFRLMYEMAEVLEEKYGREGLETAAEVFARLGAQDGELMKSRLGLGDTLHDALDAWVIVGNIMGAKIKPRWVSDMHVETEHPYCPQHEVFVERGKIYCEHVCLPYVNTLAKTICPAVEPEVVRAANMDHACVKALMLPEEKAE